MNAVDGKANAGKERGIMECVNGNLIYSFPHTSKKAITYQLSASGLRF
jgi:hypothetical protein